MNLKNSDTEYGWASIALHWVMAVMVAALYLLGDYIIGLSYYDPLYRTLPMLHKSFGVIFILLLVGRVVWVLTNPRPKAPKGTPRWQVLSARAVHLGIYLLMIAIPVTGYLISTADGRSLEVFGLFSLPPVVLGIEQQEEIAGDLHRWLANSLLALVVLHLAAALKHHFYNKDQTLVRMLGRYKES